MAQTIFQVNERLDDHPDLLITKLVSKKVTFVHRKLWPELFAIGSAREPWQMQKLPASAKTVLKRLDNECALSTERLAVAKPGDAARELEFRLLVHSQQFHTEGGKHAKHLETWEHWAERAGVSSTVSAEDSRKKFEMLLDEMNKQFSGNGTFPWQKRG